MGNSALPVILGEPSNRQRDSGRVTAKEMRVDPFWNFDFEGRPAGHPWRRSRRWSRTAFVAADTGKRRTILSMTQSSTASSRWRRSSVKMQQTSQCLHAQDESACRSAPSTKAGDKTSAGVCSDQLKPDCNQSARLFTGKCLSVRARPDGRVCVQNVMSSA